MCYNATKLRKKIKRRKPTVSDNFKKMKPEGIAIPNLSKEEVKEKVKKEADALEKNLDRAARKLQDGKSILSERKHRG